MKRKTTLLLLIFVLCNMLLMNVSAAPISRDVLIVGNNQPDAEYSYCNMDAKEFATASIEDLILYKAIAIEYSEFNKSDKALYDTLINNGSIIMVYGKSLPLEGIQSYFGEIKIKNEEIPTGDPDASGYPKDADEPLSDGLQDDIVLLYAYKLNGDLNFGGVLDCSNEKLYNQKTGEWKKS